MFAFLAGWRVYALVALVVVIGGMGVAVAYYKNSAARAEAQAALASDQRDQYRANYEASEKARAVEQKRAEIFEEVATELEGEKSELKEQNKRDVAAIRAGELKLRVRGACPNNAPAAPNATPGERDDATTGELPREVTEDLLSLAKDADEVAKQLGSCQETIRNYLK
jgi:hypothetical protein